MVFGSCQVVQQKLQQHCAAEGAPLDLEMGKAHGKIYIPNVRRADEAGIFHGFGKPVALRAVGRGAGEDSRLRRVQNGAAVFAAMTTRSLEGSIDTAEAMRARGYGLPHRTAFSIFRLRAADTVLLCAVLVLSACLVGFSAGVALHVSFYPVFAVAHGAAAWIAYAAYALLCALPLFFGLSEVKTWRS